MLPQPFQYFTYKEALHTCTEKEIAECVNRGYISNLFYMLYHLDAVRHIYGDSIFVNSSYRDEAHNKRVGGVSTSQHLTASALDIRPFWSKDLVKLVRAICTYNDKADCFGQLIIYKTFVHIGAKDLGIKSCSAFHIIDKYGLFKSNTNL